ncbi:MAG TPA: type I methionyl aminopeptidase [Bdellovibrio sp.]|nr:type I methionyl aminopeptidase [Bdellovibrio sp.]
MIIKSEADLKGIQAVGKIVANCLQYMIHKAEPGMTSKELDDLGGAFLEKHGAQSGPKVVYDFPGFTCISLNYEAAHGVPSDKKIQKGDMLNVDVSAVFQGYYADNGGSTVIPPGKKQDFLLLEATKLALENAILAVRAGAAINQIGANIEKIADKYGFSIIENLGSHGVGKSLHEEPKFIAGYYDKDDKRVLKEGHVITIEPFLSTGAFGVDEAEDGWTLITGPEHRTAQFEHTMIVLKDRALIVTIPDPL